MRLQPSFGLSGGGGTGAPGAFIPTEDDPKRGVKIDLLTEGGGADWAFRRSPPVGIVPREATLLNVLTVKMTGAGLVDVEETGWSVRIFSAAAYTSPNIGVVVSVKRLTITTPHSPYTWGQVVTALESDPQTSQYGLSYELVDGVADSDLVPTNAFDSENMTPGVNAKTAYQWYFDEARKVVEFIQPTDQAQNTAGLVADEFFAEYETEDIFSQIKVTVAAGTNISSALIEAPEEPVDCAFGVWDLPDEGGTGNPVAQIAAQENARRGLAVELLVKEGGPDWLLRRLHAEQIPEVVAANASATHLNTLVATFTYAGSIRDFTGAAGNQNQFTLTQGTSNTAVSVSGLTGGGISVTVFISRTVNPTWGEAITALNAATGATQNGITFSLASGTADGDAVPDFMDTDTIDFTGGADAAPASAGTLPTPEVAEVNASVTFLDTLVLTVTSAGSAQDLTGATGNDWYIFAGGTSNANPSLTVGSGALTIGLPDGVSYTWNQAVAWFNVQADFINAGLTASIADGADGTAAIPDIAAYTQHYFTGGADSTPAIPGRPSGTWTLDEANKIIELVPYITDAENTAPNYVAQFAADDQGLDKIIKLTTVAKTTTGDVLLEVPEEGETDDIPFGWNLATGEGGGAGTTINTVGWFTAYQAATAEDAVLLISRITADETLDGETRELPIITDRIGWGENTAVIERVENLADQKFTTLSLAGPLGAAVEAGEVIRIDRLQYAEVARDTVDGATVAHTGATQPTITWPGAVTGNSLTITYRTSNGHHLGAANNGTTLELDTGDESAGANYNLSKTQFTLRMTAAAPTLTELKQALDHYLGGYFSTAITGDGTDTVDLSQDTRSFAGGVDATDGTISVALHGAYPNIQVDDFIFFKTSPEVKRKITGVAHTASETTLTLETRLDAVIADDTAVRIDREIGYNEATASVKGRTGAAGADGRDGTDGTNGVNGINGTDGTNGTDGSDGTTTEYLYTSSTDGAALTANLPLISWNYQQAGNGGLSRGSVTYYSFYPPDLSAERPYLIRFQRQVPGSPAAGDDVGQITFTQEPAIKVIAVDGVDGDGAAVSKEWIIWERQNAVGDGTILSLGNGSSRRYTGASIPAGNIVGLYISVSYDSADTATSGTTKVRLWKNDSQDPADFLCEGRIDFTDTDFDGPTTDHFHGQMTLYTGTLTFYTDTTLANEAEATSVAFDNGDVIICELEDMNGGLAGPDNIAVTAVVEEPTTTVGGVPDEFFDTVNSAATLQAAREAGTVIAYVIQDFDVAAGNLSVRDKDFAEITSLRRGDLLHCDKTRDPDQWRLTNRARINNPRGYWWLDGATERDSSNFPYTLGAVPSGETRTTALKFRTNDPDERYDDPDSALDDILVATASVSSDKDTTVVGGNERTVFSLPVGRYDFLFSLESAKSMEEAHFRLFKIESGVDEDRGVGAVFPMGQNEAQPQGSMQARIPDVVVDDATDQWYAAVVGHSEDNSNTTVRGFMAVEKRA